MQNFESFNGKILQMDANGEHGAVQKLEPPSTNKVQKVCKSCRSRTCCRRRICLQKIGFDEADNESRQDRRLILARDPSCGMVFLSSSSTGIRAQLLVEPSSHPGARPFPSPSSLRKRPCQFRAKVFDIGQTAFFRIIKFIQFQFLHGFLAKKAQSQDEKYGRIPNKFVFSQPGKQLKVTLSSPQPTHIFHKPQIESDVRNRFTSSADIEEMTRKRMNLEDRAQARLLRQALLKVAFFVKRQHFRSKIL